MSNLLDLPHEMLTEIFKKLDLESKLQLARTCNALTKFVSYPFHWIDLTFTEYKNFTNLMNIKFVLHHHGKYVEKLSITFVRPTDITILAPEIFWCTSLSKLSVTNIYMLGDYTNLIYPPVAEFHKHEYSRTNDKLEYPLYKPSTRYLNVMNISSNHYKFTNWVNSGYFPPYLNVMLPRIICREQYLNFRTLMQVKSLLRKHQPKTPVRRAACLTFHQPLLKYASLPLVPVAQFHFSPPDMVPTIHYFYNPCGLRDLLLVNDGWPYKVYSSIVSLPSTRSFNASPLRPSIDRITSLQILYEEYMTGLDLVDIAPLCPKLLHLDIRYSDNCLINLRGLESFALRCSDLQSLNIDTENPSLPVNLKKLWQVIGEMKKLRVLMVGIYFIPMSSEPVILPALRAVTVLYNRDNVYYRSLDIPLKFSEKNFVFFTSMTSLNYFRFKSIPGIDVLSGMHTILTSFTQLTHLYIDKIMGYKLIFPLNPVLYRSIEKFYLSCDDFVMPDELANTLAMCQCLVKCRGLKVLALKIFDAKLHCISAMFASLTKLQVFYLFSQNLFPNKPAVIEFHTFLEDIAEEQRRDVDIKIRGKTSEPMLTDTEEHQFNDYL